MERESLSQQHTEVRHGAQKFSEEQKHCLNQPISAGCLHAVDLEEIARGCRSRELKSTSRLPTCICIIGFGSFIFVLFPSCRYHFLDVVCRPISQFLLLSHVTLDSMPSDQDVKKSGNDRVVGQGAEKETAPALISPTSPANAARNKKGTPDQHHQDKETESKKPQTPLSRAAIDTMEIDLLDCIIDNTKKTFASRHVSIVTKMDGMESHVEVGLFGSFDEDGRFNRVSEMSRLM